MQPEQLIFSPSEFVEICNQSLEYAYSRITIEGEVTNLRVSKGKWVYFDLKDEGASLKCFATVYVLPGPIEDGMLVKVVCTPRLHPQFNFSLTVASITPSGQGALVRAAELLQKKLSEEGLFDESRKRPLPYPPEHIALVASSESAAYADFTKILRARWPASTVSLYDVLVQGESSPAQIVAALKAANEASDTANVIVVTRGGGSRDDLAAFNDERVVRAIASSRIPTLVAIGHEIDESLAELASDARASTPSNAAELLVPDMSAELQALESDKATLLGAVRGLGRRVRLEIQTTRNQIATLIENLVTTERRSMLNARQLMQAYNPSEVLKRGYAMVKKDDHLIRRSQDLARGEVVSIVLYDGERRAEIL